MDAFVDLSSDICQDGGLSQVDLVGADAEEVVARGEATFNKHTLSPSWPHPESRDPAVEEESGDSSVVLVEGLTPELDTEYFELFFSSRKSGGEEIRAITMDGKQAVITYFSAAGKLCNLN